MKTPNDADLLFGDIRPEGTDVSPENKKAQSECVQSPKR